MIVGIILIGHTYRAQALNVLVAAFDPPTAPCGRLRVLDPLTAWGGHTVRYAMQPQHGGHAFRMDQLPWADVIVTQRGFPQPNTRQLLEPILASGKPVVYETDDCLPEVPDFLGKPHYREWGPDILAWAGRVDAVTVPTQALAEYFAPHARRVHVLPNYLTGRTRPASLRAARNIEGRIEIGFAGNAGHRGDLALVAPALRAILDRRPEVRLTFFGGVPEGFAPGDRVRIVPPDWQYDLFPNRLAALGFDIGIAPLAHNPFNRCVSNLKYLEYGALGIAGVFSRVPAFEAVRDNETGLLCEASAGAWEAAIERLCANAALRHRIGEAARADVRAHWMLEPHARLWAQAYSEILSSKSRTRP